jgi:hypothetical protein
MFLQSLLKCAAKITNVNEAQNVLVETPPKTKRKCGSKNVIKNGCKAYRCLWFRPHRCMWLQLHKAVFPYTYF